MENFSFVKNVTFDMENRTWKQILNKDFEALLTNTETNIKKTPLNLQRLVLIISFQFMTFNKAYIVTCMF